MTHPVPALPAPGVRGRKRAVFLAIKETVRKEVLAGHTLRTIYVMTGADQAMSYSLFLRYVARFMPEESRLQRWSTHRPTATGPHTFVQFKRPVSDREDEIY